VLSLALVSVVGFCLASALAQDTGNWAQWRGPAGTGEAPSGDPPTAWSQDKNIRWKVKLPGRGSSTPIIWGDSIFIQTAVVAGGSAAAPAPEPAPTPATQPAGGRRGGGRAQRPTEVHQFTLLCLDRKTGNVLWSKVARQEVPHEGHHPDHGFASHSPVTDGQHIYAFFGSRGLHCFDMQGNAKWTKDLGKMQTRNSFGEGSSPALFGDIIVITWDHQREDFIIA
jgi:outer membrane protein assembly factor BamB